VTTPDPAALERENRSMARKMERMQGRLALLERMQEQNANLMRAMMSDLEAERAESERLLLNILPAPIAHRLKTEQGVIADRYESASIMFVDIVGFTPLSELMTADEMVEWLNEVYSTFDSLVQERGAEKIKMVGDGYMIATGVPQVRDDHAVVIVDLALDIRDYVGQLAPVAGRRVAVRLGVNSGPIVGGVIGTHKFQYDLWGDAVNVAARMESHGVPGRVHVTEATHDLLEDRFITERRGEIEVKGKGPMTTWFVDGRR
jgi:adenylate cyclase